MIYILLSLWMKRRITNYHSWMYWLNAVTFVTSIYRKLTFTGLYLSWDAFAPKKVYLIKCLTFRALKICSDNKIKSEFEQIKNLFWGDRKSLLIP